MAKARYAAKMRCGLFFSKNKPIIVIYKYTKIYSIGFQGILPTNVVVGSVYF
jgi:hypothetical protein